ncbi:MAG: hypothetical protein IT290_09150, partial [Deltaproteobacteria bacterium]|nr:hypothetical protein [Deltaproteobacteria bacterium]
MAILHSPAERRYCSERGLPLVDRPAHERLREMFLFINYIHLSASSCARTHKRMLSWIPQSAGFTVWDMGEWEKDDWDATDYGRPYNFNRPFFDQFDELFRAVPIYNLSNVVATMENSEFTNCIVNAKNSYLCFECNGIEDSLYCFSMHKCRDAIESTSVARSELCYRCFNIAECYNVLFVEDSSGCSDSAFLSNCIGCKHCFGCVNLTRREFCYFNEQLSAEEYRRRIVSHALDTTAGLTGTRFAFEKFVATFPKRAAFVSQCA